MVYHASFFAGGEKSFVAGGNRVAGIDAQAALAFLAPTYTFATPVAGGQAYGIPPEQIVGTIFATKYGVVDGHPVLTRLPEIAFIDDGPGKPVGIHRAIGRQPILAFGNSDGDWQMLQWTAAGDGPRLLGLVHHTDDEREFAYDRQSRVGRLDKAWDDAVAKGWTVVDMKR